METFPISLEAVNKRKKREISFMILFSQYHLKINLRGVPISNKVNTSKAYGESLSICFSSTKKASKIYLIFKALQ